jgi:hypothetical protein
MIPRWITCLVLVLCFCVRSTVAFVVGTTSICRRYKPSPFGYSGADLGDDAPLAVDNHSPTSMDLRPKVSSSNRKHTLDDPALVDFTDSSKYYASHQLQNKTVHDNHIQHPLWTTTYPFATMLSGSAAYIASHAGQTAVFHLPGELLASDSLESNQLLHDMGLAWLLGIKLVVVVGGRHDLDTCDMDFTSHAHECHNQLKVTDAATLRKLEEEAGYLRTEVERKCGNKVRYRTRNCTLVSNSRSCL